jgi:membrane protease YdiL (CAAX protease family)
MMTIVEAVAVGMLVMLAGTLPRNALFAANLQIVPRVPWAVPAIAIYLVAFCWYLDGHGAPADTQTYRRTGLRANRVPGVVWFWSLATGVAGIVALVVALRVANQIVALPEQQLPDLSGVPSFTVWALLIAAAPVAGIVEEAAFRGYMQGKIEPAAGLPAAILITGTMFAVAHLDFTLVLWPYYVAVAAIYGMVTYRTNSIMPAIVLHTAGNLYSNLDLWLYGHAEWQAAAGPSVLIWKSGVDPSLVSWSFALVGAGAAAAGAYLMLVRVTPSQGRAFARSF